MCMCACRGVGGGAHLKSGIIFSFVFFNQEKLDLCCINHQPSLI